MDRVTSAAIDFAETAYDLELGDSQWLPKLLEAGLPMLDQGLGVAGVVYDRPPEGGAVATREVHVASGPSDFAERYAQANSQIPPEILRSLLRPCLATTLSELGEEHPAALTAINGEFDYWKDALGITAVGPQGVGVHIVSALPKVTRLTGRSRERWQMLAAHVCAGHRLRRAIAEPRTNGSPKSGFPHDAEAVLDPKRFAITDAKGSSKNGSAAKSFREAAIQADRARGRLRKTDPEKALEIWKALVRGRWSMVDWLDSDDRRLILAVPNPPEVVSPRGLTEREMQVVTYAIFGHSNKFIAYQLGISKARVSLLLSSSMQKLGARTPAQLVKQVRDLRGLHVKEVRRNRRR